MHAYTLDELIVRLRRVFERCRQRNLKLNASKCEFGLTEIKVLGHVITSQGVNTLTTNDEYSRLGITLPLV